MKKSLIALFVIALVLGGLVSVPSVKAAILYYTHNAVNGKTATSSTAYVIGGKATTTDVFTSDGWEQVSYYITLTSSTTPPTVCYQVESSNDGVFWYSQTNTYASSTIGISGPQENCFTYASTTATSATSSQMVTGADGKEIALFREVVIRNLDSAYNRTLFYIRPGVAGRLGVERSLKNPVVITK